MKSSGKVKEDLNKIYDLDNFKKIIENYFKESTEADIYEKV
jgi:hypothetical protein